MALCRLVIATELTINASSQYTEYDFSSMAKFAGKYYGGNEDGLFEIETGSDDAGVDIAASFKLFMTDFGERNLKRMRSLFLRGEADGSLKIKVTDDEDNERSYTLENVYAGNKARGQKVPIGRDGKGVFWSVEVENVSGSDFSIDAMDVIMLFLKTTDTNVQYIQGHPTFPMLTVTATAS